MRIVGGVLLVVEVVEQPTMPHFSISAGSTMPNQPA